MSKFFKMMLFENEQLSYTRVISFVMLLLLIGVTLYLVITGHRWDHYDTLANLSGGGSAATQIANKFINSKYNSAQGTYQEKNDAE